MIEWTGTLSLIDAKNIAILFVAAIAIHEFVHILAFTVFRVPVDIEFRRRSLSIAITPRTRPPRWQVVIASLVPAIVPAGIVAMQPSWFALPMNWRWALTLAVTFIALLPSPGDLYTALMYHPHGIDGVTADG